MKENRLSDLEVENVVGGIKSINNVATAQDTGYGDGGKIQQNTVDNSIDIHNDNSTRIDNHTVVQNVETNSNVNVL